MREKKEMTTITVRMPAAFLVEIDEKRGVIKREPFIRAILAQVLSDKKFVLKVQD